MYLQGKSPDHFKGPEQKRRWLPGMATGEIVGAYALTAPGAGSHAMAIKPRATRDGDACVINGQKHWITNAGIANVMVAFAKVDEARHTAFIVPFDTPGVSLGAEENRNPGDAALAPEYAVGNARRRRCTMVSRNQTEDDAATEGPGHHASVASQFPQQGPIVDRRIGIGGEGP